MFGEDAFAATTSTGLTTFPDELVLAQAGTIGAIAILVNVGDDDNYFAATSGGFPTIAQAWAQQGQVEFTVCDPLGPIICNSTFINVGEAILVEVYGNDTYNVVPCPGNGGSLPTTHSWGDAGIIPVTCTIPGYEFLSLGIDTT